MEAGPEIIIECPHCRALAKTWTLLSGNTIEARWWTDGKMDAPMMPEHPLITECKGCRDFYWLPDAKVVSEYGPFDDDFREYDDEDDSIYDKYLDLLDNMSDEERLDLHVKEFEARQCERMLEEEKDDLPKKEDDLSVEEYEAEIEAMIEAAVEEDEPPHPWPEATWFGIITEEMFIKALAAGAAENRNKELYLRIQLWWAINDPFRENYNGSHSKVQSAHTAPDLLAEAAKSLERLMDLLDVDDPQERIMKAEVARELERFDEALAILEYDFPPELEPAAAFIRKLSEKADCVVREIKFGYYSPKSIDSTRSSDTDDRERVKRIAKKGEIKRIKELLRLNILED